MNCLLCRSIAISRREDAFECADCQLVFKNPQFYYNSNQDLKRYSTHNNNEQDAGYIDFLKRIVSPLTSFLPKHFTALDFGCGPGPILSLLLSEKGGLVENYDPLFFNNTEILNKTYDVVTSSEVVEHFKDIEKDWELLIGLVKPQGLLAIMSLFISTDIDYKSWWYKNDPTHVVFYHENTFNYLAKRFELEILYNDNKSVIIFRKN